MRSEGVDSVDVDPGCSRGYTQGTKAKDDYEGLGGVEGQLGCSVTGVVSDVGVPEIVCRD